MKKLQFALWIFSILAKSFCTLHPALAQAQKEDRFIFLPDSLKHGHTHASAVVECPNGDLLACWYEGKGDRSADVRIQAARLKKGAKHWSESFLLADTPNLSDNNPCMIIDQKKRLWLFYYTLLGSPDEAWETAFLRLKISSRYQHPVKPIVWDCERDISVQVRDLDAIIDKLCTDTENRIGADRDELCKMANTKLQSQLARRLGWTTRARPIFLQSGELLLPMASEIFGIATMGFTADDGRSWRFATPPLGYAVEQPTVVERMDGTLVALFRDGSNVHRIRKSTSQDQGTTWSPVIATELPNPGSGLEILRLRSGKIVLIYNDVEVDPRNRLVVSLSDDEGATWKWSRCLECGENGRFDYPSIIQGQDGMLHATFSYNLKTIKHVVFSETWIKENE